MPKILAAKNWDSFLPRTGCKAAVAGKVNWPAIFFGDKHMEGRK